MGVIKKLGERVEKEHNQFLRDSQRLEDRSSLNTNGNANGVQSFAGSVDFEHLVGGSNGIPAKSTKQTNSSWEDDVWGSIFSDDVRAGVILPFCANRRFMLTPPYAVF